MKKTPLRPWNKEDAEAQIKELTEIRDNADKNIKRIRDEIIDHCKHDIRETKASDYIDDEYNTLSPFRVCLNCGLAEEIDRDFGLDYKRLKTSRKPKQIDRLGAYAATKDFRFISTKESCIK